MYFYLISVAGHLVVVSSTNRPFSMASFYGCDYIGECDSKGNLLDTKTFSLHEAKYNKLLSLLNKQNAIHFCGNEDMLSEVSSEQKEISVNVVSTELTYRVEDDTLITESGSDIKPKVQEKAKLTEIINHLNDWWLLSLPQLGKIVDDSLRNKLIINSFKIHRKYIKKLLKEILDSENSLTNITIDISESNSFGLINKYPENNEYFRILTLKYSKGNFELFEY